MELAVCGALMFAAFAAVIGAGEGQENPECAFHSRGTIDPYSLFNTSKTRFWMLKSNYNLSKNVDDTRCLHTGMNPTPFRDHGLRTLFMYTNFTNKKERGMKYINLTFFHGEGSSKYDWVNSTADNWFEMYNISLPQWNVRYANENCTVVEVRSVVKEHQEAEARSGEDAQTYTNCELWRVEHLSSKLSKGLSQPPETTQERKERESDYFEGEISCCERYFTKHCKQSIPYQVFDPELCE